MKITEEQKEELWWEWRKIGDNDCLPPSDELTTLFLKMLDQLSEE